MKRHHWFLLLGLAIGLLLGGSRCSLTITQADSTQHQEPHHD